MKNKKQFLIFTTLIIVVTMFTSGGMPIFSNPKLFGGIVIAGNEEEPPVGETNIELLSPTADNDVLAKEYLNNFPGTYSFENDLYNTEPDEWKLGYYPATYGFEESTELNGWSLIQAGGAISIASEIGEHKNVVHFDKTTHGEKCTIYQDLPTARAEGTIEFWVRTSATNEKQTFTVRTGGLYGIKLVQVILDSDGKLGYYNNGWQDGFSYSADTWYWFSVYIDMDVDTYDLTVYDEEGTEKHDGSGYNFLGDYDDGVSFDNIRFSSGKYFSGWDWYVDAIGLSWTGYTPGDNLHDSLLEIYEIDGCTISIEDDIDSHHKVAKISDGNNDGSIYYSELKSYFEEENVVSGTIEWWFRSSDCTKRTLFILENQIELKIYVDDEQFYYSDFSNYQSVSGLTIKSNKWYHFRIDFECGLEGYMDLYEDQYDIYIDGEKVVNGAHINPVTSFSAFRIKTKGTDENYQSYIDAIGFSWDDYYEINDNRDMGLTLRYEYEANLRKVWYSLNYQSYERLRFSTPLNLKSEVINVIKMPSYGENHVWLKGKDLNGDNDYSNTKDFFNYYVGYQYQTLEWGIDKINAERIWGSFEDALHLDDSSQYYAAGLDINLLVLDNGIDYTHNELVNNYQGGYDFVDEDDNPFPSPTDPINFHGTFCSGIIAAEDNEEGIIGVAPKVNLYVGKISNADHMVAAFDWAIDSKGNPPQPTDGIHVISMSMSLLNPTSQEITDIKNRIKTAWEAGIVVVIAAGNYLRCNNEVPDVQFPANYWGYTIPVGAVDPDLTIADKWKLKGSTTASCYGYSQDEGVVAPGTFICSTVMNDQYNCGNGTSFACPMVAGLCALILDIDMRYDNEIDLTPDQVRDFIYDNCVDLGDTGWDEIYGWGLIDVEESVKAAYNLLYP